MKIQINKKILKIEKKNKTNTQSKVLNERKKKTVIL